ncbi:hypothetical protein EYF80_045872 [Liparis tanakae]|uniref:Uncharacterized protein n=1 Tax=Liparis tanakae TaxID=230148 RepID=A0A4Z2FSM8_9TELE|nr:hypothetical protein EYF80_045872 [Liparis tanakae]
MTTVSADAKLIPKPPALVDNRKQNHVHTEDLFHFGRERFLHVFLHAPQKEGLQDFVETLITVIRSFPVHLVKILPGIKPVVHDKDIRRHSSPAGISNRRRFSARLQRLNRDVLVGHEEVQQRPELFEGVLQRSPGNEEPVVGPELHQCFVEQGVVVLQPVSNSLCQEVSVERGTTTKKGPYS